MATLRSSAKSCARYTVAMPPRPSSASTSYSPMVEAPHLGRWRRLEWGWPTLGLVSAGGAAELSRLAIDRSFRRRVPWAAMLASLGFASLLAIVGTFAAVVWTYLLRIGGAPGSTLIRVGTRRQWRALVKAGAALSFLLEAYLLLAFAGLVTRFVEAYLAPRPDAPGWPLWIVGWYLATAPVLFGGRDVPGAAARDASDTALTFALPLAAIGFWVFVVWPEVLEAAWSWLPRFSL